MNAGPITGFAGTGRKRPMKRWPGVRWHSRVGLVPRPTLPVAISARCGEGVRDVYVPLPRSGSRPGIYAGLGNGRVSFVILDSGRTPVYGRSRCRGLKPGLLGEAPYTGPDPRGYRRTELVPFVGQGRKEKRLSVRQQKVGEMKTEQVPFYEGA